MPEDLDRAFDNNGTDEGWVRELIGHMELFRRILIERHNQAMERTEKIRDAIIRIETLSARRTTTRGNPQPGDPDPAKLIKHAEALLAECWDIHRGDKDGYGPEVTWERLDRMMSFARARVLTGFNWELESHKPYVRAQQVIHERNVWLGDDPRVLVEFLKEATRSLREARLSLGRTKWDRFVRSVKDKSLHAILQDVGPFLESAKEPLTRKKIQQEFKCEPEWSLLGKALALAVHDKDKVLANRRTKPQGYFFPDRFPHLVEPSK
jgi:hypothetical protein